MVKKVWGLLAVLSMVVAGVVWTGQRPPPTVNAPAAAGRPVPVEAATAARRDVPVLLQGLGNVQAYNTVTVRPQVDGQLIQVAFTEGQTVRAGEVLARIDPRSYQAALDQALAKKTQDEAQLANARNDLQRYSGLLEHNYSSRQQYDTTRSLVAQLEAAVRGDQAAVDSARVQLGYTTLTAPLEGRAGIRLVDQGNIVRAGDSGGLVTITQMQPISVVFTLPEKTVTRLVKGMTAEPPPVVVLSRDGKETLDQGRLTLVDNQIDPATGTIRLKATLPNRDGLLWPGQFVTVRVTVEIRLQALSVPATAVLRGQQGAYAYVIKADGTVEMRPLTVGPIADGMAVIESGIAEGETVVTAGQYRLQPGARVEVRAPSAVARSGRVG